jgi:hypothetical protein
MVAVSLIAGIGLLLAGLVAIGLGIPVKEFSFGNTLIVVGALAACTGIVMLGLSTVVRELKNISRQLGRDVPSESWAGDAPPSEAASTTYQGPEHGFLFSRDQRAAENVGTAGPAASPTASSPRPWHEDAASRDRVRHDVPASAAPEQAPTAPKARRDLLFSSSRRERERAQARTTERFAADLPPAAESGEAPPARFEDGWARSERLRTADAPPRRSGRTPSTSAEASPGAANANHYTPVAGNEHEPPVTVLKSGVVDGMAYSLYSDGSIEAQMPEGMMRFASIDELRAHLDQRP